MMAMKDMEDEERGGEGSTNKPAHFIVWFRDGESFVGKDVAEVLHVDACF
jgi:hypothetical protein